MAHRFAPPTPPPLRVGILSPVRFYRDGLARLLANSGVEVSRSMMQAHGLPEHVSGELPDVMLVDVSCHAGRAMLHEVARYGPDLPVVALAVSGCDVEVLACAQAGVAGYVTSDASFDELLSIITSVAHGELRCLPTAADILRRRLADLAGSGAGASEVASLTSRELEIVHLLDRGLSNKQIAARLGIEVSTVKCHVHRILEKLHVSRRVEAAMCLQHPLSLPADGSRAVVR